MLKLITATMLLITTSLWAAQLDFEKKSSWELSITKGEELYLCNLPKSEEKTLEVTFSYPANSFKNCYLRTNLGTRLIPTSTSNEVKKFRYSGSGRDLTMRLTGFSKESLRINVSLQGHSLEISAELPDPIERKSSKSTKPTQGEVRATNHEKTLKQEFIALYQAYIKEKESYMVTMRLKMAQFTQAMNDYATSLKESDSTSSSPVSVIVREREFLEFRSYFNNCTYLYEGANRRFTTALSKLATKWNTTARKIMSSDYIDDIPPPVKVGHTSQLALEQNTAEINYYTALRNKMAEKSSAIVFTDEQEKWVKKYLAQLEQKQDIMSKQARTFSSKGTRTSEKETKTTSTSDERKKSSISTIDGKKVSHEAFVTSVLNDCNKLLQLKKVMLEQQKQGVNISVMTHNKKGEIREDNESPGFDETHRQCAGLLKYAASALARVNDGTTKQALTAYYKKTKKRFEVIFADKDKA